MSEPTIESILAKRKEDGFPEIGSDEALAQVIKAVLGMADGGPVLRYIHDASALLVLLARRSTEPSGAAQPVAEER